MCNERRPPDDLDVVSETNPSHDPLRALLETAASPATTAELGDVEAAVAAFRSGLASPASGTVQGSRAVLLRRVPRRAVGVVVGTLLVAGTAAAAATDVLPSWVPVVGHETTDESVALDESSSSDLDPETDETVAGVPGSDEGAEGDDTDETTSIDGTGTPSVVSVPEQSSRDWGWCTAWSKGGGDTPSTDDGSTVSERLAVLAEADGITVEEFCAGVLATPPNQKDPGHGKPGTDPTDTVSPSETVPTGNNGNGNGNGNGSSNGKGGGNANGKPADTTTP